MKPAKSIVLSCGLEMNISDDLYITILEEITEELIATSERLQDHADLLIDQMLDLNEESEHALLFDL